MSLLGGIIFSNNVPLPSAPNMAQFYNLGMKSGYFPIDDCSMSVSQRWNPLLWINTVFLLKPYPHTTSNNCIKKKIAVKQKQVYK